MKRCLVIDDQDVIRKVARHILEKLDYTVQEADSTQRAAEICDDAMPDVVLVDWHLPGGMSPMELIARIRNTRGDRRPLIIYCTTELDVQDICRAFGAGADHYLMKPFDRSALETVIEALPRAA